MRATKHATDVDGMACKVELKRERFILILSATFALFSNPSAFKLAKGEDQDHRLLWGGRKKDRNSKTYGVFSATKLLKRKLCFWRTR